MALPPPSRSIFESSRQRARRRAYSGVRFLIAAVVILGVGVVVLLLVLLLVGVLVG